jgi:two-component system, OmpR family, phosphate regulon response regulator PhoB
VGSAKKPELTPSGPVGRILIVDDEEDLVRLVSYNLARAGFELLSADNGRDALKLAQRERPDVMILDLMLPDLSGVHVCQRLKQDPETKSIPIIMLTARSSETDRIAGFEAGADDYVVKPFSPRELVLRVKALLARTQGPAQAPSKQDATIDIGALKILPADHCVMTANGEALSLTNLEFQILLSLAQAPNRVRTREQLIEAVWRDGGEDMSDRTVDTHIKRLRKKLGDAKDCIETIRGVGYRMVSAKPSLEPVP